MWHDLLATAEQPGRRVEQAQGSRVKLELGSQKVQVSIARNMCEMMKSNPIIQPENDNTPKNK